MSEKRITLYYSFIITMLLALFIAPNTAGAGADAELHNVDVLASPPSQGVGGEIIVDATVHIYGGCCYHLYAFEVTATLFLPEEVTIAGGPTPEMYEEVDAQPGGVATTVHFRWTVVGNAKGLFDLTVIVSTKNCGSVDNSVAIDIVEGCSISPPEIYPEKPNTDRDTILSVTALHPLEGKKVEGVTLFYVTGRNIEGGVPSNDTIIMPNERKVTGTAIEMERDAFLYEMWTGKIETRDSGTLYYWFVANDNFGENTTSSLYEMEVIDQEAMDTAVGGMFWGLVIALIIGCLLIFVVQNRFLQKKQREIGIIEDTKEKDTKETNWQAVLALALFLISVVIVVTGLLWGTFSEIVDLVAG